MRKKKARMRREKTLLRYFPTFVVKYVSYGDNKVNRICAECNIHPNKLYFVTLSSIYSREGFYEARLTINAKVEGHQSSNEPNAYTAQPYNCRI